MKLTFSLNSIGFLSAGHEPQNGEEMALSRVGTELYELLFKHYTKKQVENSRENFWF